MAFEVAEAGASGLQLERRNAVLSGSISPCHLTLLPDSPGLLVSHMAGGALSCLSILPDGRLVDPPSRGGESGGVSTAQLGPPWWVASPLPADADPRGTPEYTHGPHAHCSAVDASGRRAVVTDYGRSRLAVVEIECVTDGSRSPAVAFTAPPHHSAAGSGPRHCAFDSSHRWLLVANADDSTLECLSYGVDDSGGGGRLASCCIVSALPADFPTDAVAANSTITLVVAGVAVYVANNGHNSVARFELDLETGRLELRAHTVVGIPIDVLRLLPGGFLLCGSGAEGTVLTLRVAEDGQLQRGTWPPVVGLQTVSDLVFAPPRAIASI